MRRHPLLNASAGILTRRNLRRDGKTRAEVQEAMEGFTPDLFQQACEAAEQRTGRVVPDFSTIATPEGVVGEFGDGHIIKAIMDFFETPLGQMILSIIKMLLMGLIAA